MSFFNTISKNIESLGHAFCVGIDPHIDLLQDFLKRQFIELGEKKFLSHFSRAHIDAAADFSPAVKFQGSFYEAFGSIGFEALKDSIGYAKDQRLPVILDIKRGDISSTMRAYAQAGYDHLGADCITINCYMGTDVLAAIQPWLEQGKAAYIVWRTSNATSDALQCYAGADGRLYYEYVYEVLQNFVNEQKLEASIGWVLGATQVDGLRDEVYQQLAASPLLLPGVGAQGAQVAGRLSELLCDHSKSLVPMSRSLAFGDSNKDLQNWDGYTTLIRKRLQEQISLINK